MIKNKKILVPEEIPEFRRLIDNMSEESKMFVDLSLVLANNIHELIEKRCITQKDFADKLEKTEPEVSKWLAGGQNFTVRTICKIAAALGVTVVELITDKN